MVTAVSNLCGLAQHRCWLHQHWPQPSAVVHPLQSRPQVTRTSRHKSSCSNSRGHATQHGKSRKHGTESRKSSSAPVKPAQSAKPHDTLTAPMQVKVLAQLSKLEQAANPWWSTFCGVTNGLWLGQTAAFAPSTGQPEAVAKSNEGKPILDLFTQCAEDRVCEGPQDYVLRRTVESESEAELASAASNANLSDIEEDSVYADELGLVFFDGGSYSRGPLCLAEEGSPDSSTTSQKAAEGTHMHQGHGAQLQRQQTSDHHADEEDGVAAEADVGGSRGPHEAGRVVTLEQCLTWGGEQRKRCRITLAVSGGGDTGEELDISLLRVRLFHEAWQGMLHNLDDATLRANSAVPSAANANNSAVAEDATASSSQDAAKAMPKTVSSSVQHHSAENVDSYSGTGSSGLEQAREAKSEAMSNSMEAQVQQEARTQSEQQASSSATDSSRQHSAAAAGADLSQGPCIHSKQLEGSWKVFDLAAVPIDETDVETGITRKAMVYFSQETQQSWASGSETLDTASQQEEEGDVDGGALWLPGNVTLELQMLPMVSRGEVADKVEGISTSNTGRGVLLTFSWLVRSGMMISMQREYDAAGDLMEVRSRSAVEGSWVGGRM